jgi:hypothetical protein
MFISTHTHRQTLYFQGFNGYDLSGLNEDIVLWCGVYTSNNSINRLYKRGLGYFSGGVVAG